MIFKYYNLGGDYIKVMNYLTVLKSNKKAKFVDFDLFNLI